MTLKTLPASGGNRQYNLLNTFHMVRDARRKIKMSKVETDREEQVQRPWDSTGGPVVKILSFNASGHRFDPGQGTKISHAIGQPSLHASVKDLV